MKMVRLLVLFVSLFILSGCSTKIFIKTTNDLPKPTNSIQITLFKLNNYTDTPRAGMRAANIVEGVLHARGYIVKTHIKSAPNSLTEAKEISKNDNSTFFIVGGVSEWRYKTGIDGEPAVSLRLSMYDTKDMKLVWSSTGSNTDWGTGSIGSTAQRLIENMIKVE